MPLSNEERAQIDLYMNSLKMALDTATAQTGGHEPVPGTGQPPGWPMQPRPIGDEDHERRVREREENLRRENERNQAQTFNGASGVRAKDTTPADRVYLAHAQSYGLAKLAQAGKARSPTPDVYKLLLVGSLADINAAKDVRSHADAQGELSKFNADPGEWTRRYAGSKIERAFHAWLTAELAK